MSASGKLSLSEAVERIIDEDHQLYGFTEEAIVRARVVLGERGAQERLVGELEAALSRPLAHEQILEVGCGTGSFLFSLLERGFDASGIDNSAARLAVATEKIRCFDYPATWIERLSRQNALSLEFNYDSFDIVVGHQFIEHVPSVPIVVFELARLLRRGGSLVLWAPDYRGPFEPHYGIPWPPFASRSTACAWLDVFGRPYGGLDDFNYVTLPQVVAICQGLGLTVERAWIDRQIDPGIAQMFKFGSLRDVRECATSFRDDPSSLPEQLRAATSFGIVARKP